FMNLLAHRGIHDLNDETFNAYGQMTFIASEKLPFSARYSGPASLSPNAETSWTGTLTLFAGLRLWPGGEAYFVPELVADQPLSGLKGLGGAIQNFELQKNGATIPEVYRSRIYLQQTLDLGGPRSQHVSNPQELGKLVDSRRLVFRVGNFSVIDF